LRSVCIEISERYESNFIEIGYESDHVHFFLQSIPRYSVSEIVAKVKSITARELFNRHPEIKKQLLGGSFWTSGYYANTVGLYGSERRRGKYLQNSSYRVCQKAFLLGKSGNIQRRSPVCFYVYFLRGKIYPLFSHS